MMPKTQIIKHSDVEDYFIDLPRFSSLQAYGGEYGDQLALWYEQGKVIIMDDAPIDADFDLLWDVTYPYGDRATKKMKMRNLLGSADKNPLLKKIFGEDITKAKRYQDEARRISTLVQAGLQEMFPRYRFLGEAITWRFSCTHNEDLHLDLYKQRRDVHWLRVFWNADSFPRIWYCGKHLEDIIRERDFGPFEHPEDLNKKINATYLGETLGRVPSSAPYHIAHMAPGTMWMAHSEYIPHTCTFGRRLVGFSIEVDPESMLDPSLCFHRFGRRLAEGNVRS